MNIDNFKSKLEISETAVGLYKKHDENFTIHLIAEETDYTVAEIFDYFDNKKDIVRFFYTSLVVRYRSMIDEIEDFESYTLSEKLSNFILASFDLMKEHEYFVKVTFYPLIVNSFKKTEYEKQVHNLFAEFFHNDSLISASGSFLLNDCSFYCLQRKYLRLVKFWLNDESENKELTMELTDKLTGIIQEVMYTSVADRSVDLIKFLYSNRVLTCNNPLFKKISSTFQIR